MNINAGDKGPQAERESFSELLGQLFKYSALMVRDEIELVIRGIREKAKNVCNGALIVAVGVLIGFAAFLAFCTAAILGLALYMAPVYAALVMAVGLAIIGIVIALIGYGKLKKSFDNREEPKAEIERMKGNE